MIISLSTTAQVEYLKAYEDVFKQASKNSKNVILVFGHKYCGWCRVFNYYHASLEVDSILSKYFLIEKVDILESETGKKLYEYYMLPGTPAWIIFNSEMNILSDGKDENGNMIGYPYKQNEIQAYLSVISNAAPNINDEELNILATKLKFFGDLKYNNQTQNGS